MALYRLDDERVDPMGSIPFGAAKVLEDHLKKYISNKPQVLEDGLFVIATEFGWWEDSKRRIDLLGLDRDGRLVVVELKRTENAGHAELQAIRYAAMVSNITKESIVNAHRNHLESLQRDQEDAETRIEEHLGDNDVDTGRPRIIIAAGDFSKEITTSVLWLSEFRVEIKCVKLTLYEMDDGKKLLHATQIIPLPETADYYVTLQKKEEEEREEKKEKKRSARFKFHMAGIQEGAELVLKGDESSDAPRTCRAGPEDTATVIYDGKETTLSGLAQELLQKPSLQGPVWWTHKGKTLDELRKENESATHGT